MFGIFLREHQLDIACDNLKAQQNSNSKQQKNKPIPTNYRGMVTLDNGITVYYAETFQALNTYRGQRDFDIGIVLNASRSCSGLYEYFDGAWTTGSRDCWDSIYE